jgi:hypothetical protein
MLGEIGYQSQSEDELQKGAIRYLLDRPVGTVNFPGIIKYCWRHYDFL